MVQEYVNFNKNELDTVFYFPYKYGFHLSKIRIEQWDLGRPNSKAKVTETVMKEQ